MADYPSGEDQSEKKARERDKAVTEAKLRALERFFDKNPDFLKAFLAADTDRPSAAIKPAGPKQG